MKSGDALLKEEGFFNPKEKAWKILVEDSKSNHQITIVTNYVSIASGHHGTPEYARFSGQETFKGN